MILAVTGATGFLGRHFVPAALEAGHAVRALARAPGARPPGATWITGGLGDGDALTRLLEGADVLVHLAALGVQGRDRDWAETARVNVVESLACLARAEALGVRRAVVAGTCTEYAGAGRLPDAPCVGEPPACAEDAPLEPNDAYGASKAAGGTVLRAFGRERGLALWYLRFASMYGRDDDQDKILPAVIRAARAGSRFAMSAGEQVREWLHVDDAVAALLAALGHAPAGVATFNVGTGAGVPLAAIARQAHAAAGGRASDLALGARPYRRGEAHWIVMDVTRAKTALGWSPRVPFDAGLARLLSEESTP